MNTFMVSEHSPRNSTDYKAYDFTTLENVCFFTFCHLKGPSYGENVNNTQIAYFSSMHQC